MAEQTSADSNHGPANHVARKENTAEEGVMEGDRSEVALEEALAQLGHFRCYHKYCVALLCVPSALAAVHAHSRGHALMADQWELECGKWRPLVETVRNSVLPVFGILLTGYVSDCWGRLPALCVLSGCAGALAVLRACSPCALSAAADLLQAALGDGYHTAGYLMAVELSRPSLRAALACTLTAAHGAGGALAALAARLAGGWRRAALLQAPLLLVPLYWRLLPESARWLHAAGRPARAAAALALAAKWNKVRLDAATLGNIRGGPARREGRLAGWAGVLRSRALVGRLAACGGCWAALAVVRGGLAARAVPLSRDRHADAALDGALQVAAALLAAMALERAGRRRTAAAALLLSGGACLAPYFVAHWGDGLGLHLVGKLSASLAATALGLSAAEVFPTCARAGALSACALAARVGAALQPLLTRLAALYGACSVGAALAVLLGGCGVESRRSALPASAGAALEAAMRSSTNPTDPTDPAPSAPRVLAADT